MDQNLLLFIVNEKIRSLFQKDNFYAADENAVFFVDSFKTSTTFFRPIYHPLETRDSTG